MKRKELEVVRALLVVQDGAGAWKPRAQQAASSRIAHLSQVLRQEGLLKPALLLRVSLRCTPLLLLALLRLLCLLALLRLLLRLAARHVLRGRQPHALRVCSSKRLPQLSWD